MRNLLGTAEKGLSESKGGEWPLFVLTRHKNRVGILIIFVTIAWKKLGVE